MAKINILKPTGGNEALGFVSAFMAENNSYVILDSEKTGSMGLPIIYVSKLVDGKLEKINDNNEWQSVKNYLKGIINGTNFQYIKVADSLNADEAFYTPLTLPQASFDLIKQRYVVKDEADSTSSSEVLEVPSFGNALSQEEDVGPALNENTMSQDVMPSMIGATENIGTVPSEASISQVPTPVVMPESPVNNAPIMSEASATEIKTNPVSVQQPAEVQMPQVVPPTTPTAQVMPTVTPASNETVNSAPINQGSTVGTPTINNQVVPQQLNAQSQTVNNETPALVEAVQEATGPMVITSFTSDKQTFLKACENMFDALVTKYQKQLADLERREQIISQKEQEIEQKMQNANEHLANAAAREQVANIAHDNAQKVMDLSNLMPQAPDSNPTGVI